MLQKYRLLRQSGLAVFDRKAIANILGVSFPSTNPILDRLVRAGILLRLKRDRYVLAEDAPGKTRKIANELVKPSALSLWTVLSDSGLTTQVPRTIQSVTTKRPVEIESDGLPTFQYAHLPATLSFGASPGNDDVFRMSPEKALLDLLYVQHGSLDWSSIDLERLDLALLRRMADRFPIDIQRILASSLLSR
ncbi:hypothetical protein HY213_04525 [Candidatus Peregrinibacteria bacterium]|nr:hypothetical protein [Candidatus Peregrinibacteria bacterium]